MATYWVFLNNEVGGPYAVEQLIRLRGFSRHTQICREDGSGKPNAWTSPDEIPELARIFKSVDEMQDAPAPARTPIKPPIPKPIVRPPRRSTPAAAAAPVSKSHRGDWFWRIAFGLLVVGLLAGLAMWLQRVHHEAQQEERHSVQSLIETTQLPASSRYATLRQCMQEHHIQPQWDLEPVTDGIYNVTLSWFTEPADAVPASAVYAFEVNLPAQNLRATNTAAEKLLAEGFSTSTNGKKPTDTPSPPASARFQAALDQRTQAIQNGDFDTVWSLFSQKKRSEMIQAGISQSGFVRLQSLTHRLETGQTLSVLKTKNDGTTRRLVLLQQTQDKHPVIFLKQIWVLENNQWKLDSEEKHSESSSTTDDTSDESAPSAPRQASVPPAPTAILAPDEPASKTDSVPPPPATTVPAADATVPTTPAAAPTAPADSKPKIPVQSLPGISN